MIGKWFEVKVAVRRTLDDGSMKVVKEIYLVDAINFTEAESRILEELKIYGEISIVGIKYCDANELIDTHNPEDGFWYKAKLSMIYVDESKGKEKKVSVNIYVRAKDFKNALNNIEQYMQNSVMDYSIVSISETAVMEFFEYKVDKEYTK